MTAGPVIAALGLAGAVVAVVSAHLRLQGWGRVVLAALCWVPAFGLTALVADVRIIMAVGYAPLCLFGLPFGWPPVDYFATAFPWPVRNQLICLFGALLWAGAALAFQRRTAGACAACGRVAGARTGWSSAASAARWGRWAAYTGFVVPFGYSLIRWAWALNIPIGMSAAEIAELHRSGLVWAGAGLATVAACGGVLTLGLIHRWGEVWPRWVPGLAGRRVPVALPVTLGGAMSAVLLTSLGSVVAMTDWNDPASWLLSPMTYWPLWGAALGAATLAYRLRRRGGCEVCGLSG
ncbi:hypothetical protein DP939_16920 [Spongiactinospora rosea]|uniref:Uncharacterized protein n=1 Tax=Spongiactinospora rosea TaxID=2248750 RepID=A0A366LZB0_9ACTN|nr:hypothetical protein DP939_16920 [Spongiactinospora rosea]